jgi:N-acetylmuramoyl-L-alanine amidase
MSFKEKFTIGSKFIPKPSKRRSGLPISKVRFIVVHDTGNPGSTALDNINYYINTLNAVPTASAHLFVDDKQILECVPALTAPPEKAWHVLYNIPKDNEMYGVNANDAAIGVEYCYGGNIDADKAYAKYLWVIAKICYVFKLNPAKDIVGHFFLDPARKTDPITGLAKSRRTYEQLLKDIVIEYNDCTSVTPVVPQLNIIAKAGTATSAMKMNLRPSPDTRGAVVEVIPVNTKLTYTALTHEGMAVNNNTTWYKDANGHWFWDGGLVHV